MASKATIVKNPSGLHLRPVEVLCKEALRYESKIFFKVRITTTNAKSVLSVLGACMKSGNEIELACGGPDEKEALEAMVDIVEAGLGEQIDGNQRL